MSDPTAQLVPGRPRSTLVLAGDAAWARQMAARHWQADGIWLGQETPPGITAWPAAKARELLGLDLSLLVVDTYAGLDPDALGAATGALVGGGLLILLTPPAAAWSSFVDPDNARHVSYPAGPEAMGGRFIRRLLAILASAPGVYRVSQHDPIPAIEALAAVPPVAAESRDRVLSPDAACLTGDQADAVAALIKVARGHRRRPLVLTADRGRGKSAALGIAAARLLADGATRIVVTAPRPAAARAVFAHAERLLTDSQRHGNRLVTRAGELVFMAPDQLLREPVPADLLLVDEAAALPVPLLTQLLARYARIAFATTVHGYEGNGRGFALRFRAVMDAHTPHWRGMTLRTPIRFPLHDPLEQWVSAALLLAAEPAAQISPPATTGDRIAVLGQDMLAADEALLEQVFGLLVQAHYQTRPADLRRLLDAPDVTVWAAMSGATVVAVALTVAEGGLDAAMATRVAQGARRPRGHLIAQSLAAHTGESRFAMQHTVRVMRIAVHPLRRRQGLGVRLIARIAAAAEAAGADWLGTSFAADTDTLAFWHAAGCTLVRIGAARDGASGSHSTTWMRPLGAAARSRMPRLHERAVDGFAHGLGDVWRLMCPAVAIALLRRTGPVAPLPAEDLGEARAYAAGQRDWATCQLGLWRSVTWAFGVGRRADGEEPLLRRLLQRWPVADVVAEAELAGAKALERRLRAAVAELLTEPVA